MIALTIAEIAGIVGGVVRDSGPDLVVAGPAFLDSRNPEPGGLFVAVAGEQADGHEYAAAAVAGGAAAVLGSRPTGVPTVVVADAQVALQQLAHAVLERLRQAGAGLSVVAVTGSQGKTSVKDMIAVVLGTHASTVATAGSFNNEWGLPLTVLRATPQTRHLVLEMGARGVGHIAALCRIARPDVALVLNVGSAHLGEFGSREAIAQAKGELVEALEASGTAVLNSDDPLVLAMASRTPARVLTFGTSRDADVRLGEVSLDDLGRPAFTLHAGQDVAVRLAVTGAHQAHNAAAAAAVALSEGMALPEVATALGDVEQVSRWRMEITDLGEGRLLINDAYNANPESMRAALDALVSIASGRADRGGRAIAVLGEMRELGADSAAAHADLGRAAAERGVAHLVGVGEATVPMVEAAIGHIAAVSVPDRAAALAWLRSHLRPDDVVLIKASRGDRLELLATSLIEEVGP